MKYRPNVAVILQNKIGQILICERVSDPGSWQFPQGGVDEGETHEHALERELLEELALKPDDYKLLKRKGPYRYLLGEGRTKKGYDGQEQHYFLADFIAADSRINVATLHQEFRDFKWIKPEEFELKWLAKMKRDVYRAVFKDFFDIDI